MKFWEFVKLNLKIQVADYFSSLTTDQHVIFFSTISMLFRGGGELGRQWYLEGKLQSKHKGFEVQ